LVDEQCELKLLKKDYSNCEESYQINLIHNKENYFKKDFLGCILVLQTKIEVMHEL
jgi:hypothetical protein